MCLWFILSFLSFFLSLTLIPFPSIPLLGHTVCVCVSFNVVKTLERAK